jgi:hypothetical protein
MYVADDTIDDVDIIQNMRFVVGVRFAALLIIAERL